MLITRDVTKQSEDRTNLALTKKFRIKYNQLNDIKDATLRALLQMQTAANEIGNKVSELHDDLERDVDENEDALRAKGVTGKDAVIAEIRRLLDEADEELADITKEIDSSITCLNLCQQCVGGGQNICTTNESTGGGSGTSGGSVCLVEGNTCDGEVQQTLDCIYTGDDLCTDQNQGTGIETHICPECHGSEVTTSYCTPTTNGSTSCNVPDGPTQCGSTVDSQDLCDNTNTGSSKCKSYNTSGDCLEYNKTGRCYTSNIGNECITSVSSVGCSVGNDVDDCNSYNGAGDCDTDNTNGNCRANNKNGNCNIANDTGSCSTDNGAGNCLNSNSTGNCTLAYNDAGTSIYNCTLTISSKDLCRNRNSGDSMCRSNNTSGDCLTNNSTGNCSDHNTSGDCSAGNNTGNCTITNTSGDCVANNDVGDCVLSDKDSTCRSTNAEGTVCISNNTTGNCHMNNSTGNCSMTNTSGDCSAGNNTGNCTLTNSTGDCNVNNTTGSCTTQGCSECQTCETCQTGQSTWDCDNCIAGLKECTGGASTDPSTYEETVPTGCTSATIASQETLQKCNATGDSYEAAVNACNPTFSSCGNLGSCDYTRYGSVVGCNTTQGCGICNTNNTCSGGQSCATGQTCYTCNISCNTGEGCGACQTSQCSGCQSLCQSQCQSQAEKCPNCYSVSVCVEGLSCGTGESCITCIGGGSHNN